MHIVSLKYLKQKVTCPPQLNKLFFSTKLLWPLYLLPLSSGIAMGVLEPADIQRINN